MATKIVRVCDSCNEELSNIEGLSVRSGSSSIIQFSNGSGTKAKNVEMNLDFCSVGCSQLWIRDLFNTVENLS